MNLAALFRHAGYDYSGSCGAFAYRQVDASKMYEQRLSFLNQYDSCFICFSKRVFILGPSHHVRLGGCALSPATIYKTPLYDLTIDQKSAYEYFKHHCICLYERNAYIVAVYEELYRTNEFQTMSPTTDEDEHSIELHLPYVAKAMERCAIGHRTRKLNLLM